MASSFEAGDASEQTALLVALGCLRNEAAIPVMLSALDGATPIAKAAAEGLDRLGSASEKELTAALRDGSSTRRQVLLPTISRAATAQAVVLCLTDAETAVRRLACEALGRIGNPLGVPALFKALEDGSPAVVQAATSAIQALGYAGTPDLAERAVSSPSPSVRRAALRILSYFGRSEAFAVVDRATRDPDPRVREAAIIGLSLLEDERAFDRLLELAADPLPQVRASALRGLGDSAKDPRGVARLRLGLSDSDPWVRYYAIQSLGKLRAEPNEGEIAALVSDPAGQVRVAAIEALSHLPGDTAFAALRAAAHSSELDLQRAALIGLGLSQRPEAESSLLEHAEAGDAATRLMALSALASFETPATLAALMRAAGDPDESIKTAAIGFLGARSGTEATRVLVGLLKDPALRGRAFFALRTPREHRVAGLLSALRGADDELAFEVTSILARLDQAEATAALFEALTLPSPAARKAAATTLGATGSREAWVILQRLSMEDSDPEVRHVCALLLARHG
jgi:HEAT repeat protein